MAILFIGNKQSGKDTAASILTKKLNLPEPISTSKPIIRDFAEKTGTTEQEILSNKDKYRQELLKFGKEKQTQDPYYPVDECIKASPIVTGIRPRKQLEICKDKFDTIVWVERPGYEDQTNELNAHDADYIINNNGDLKNLETKVDNLIQRLKITEPIKTESENIEEGAVVIIGDPMGSKLTKPTIVTRKHSKVLVEAGEAINVTKKSNPVLRGVTFKPTYYNKNKGYIADIDGNQLYITKSTISINGKTLDIIPEKITDQVFRTLGVTGIISLREKLGLI